MSTMASRGLSALAAAVVVSVAFGAAGCDPGLPAPVLEPSRPVQASASAAVLVEGLPVKGRAPKTGYSRAVFGPAWVDVDRNGCDTRNDILARDLPGGTVAPDCTVLSGVLEDPYSGETIRFVRGDGQVDIDHVVPLSDAWQKGAQQWDDTKRTAFANDPANLAAVSSTLNRQKGDSDAATWLPPNRQHWCQYGTSIAQVKTSYGLRVTGAEKTALARLVATCPTEERVTIND